MESVCRFTPTVGSNPTLSASQLSRQAPQVRGGAIGSTPAFGAGYPGSSPGPGATVPTDSAIAVEHTRSRVSAALKDKEISERARLVHGPDVLGTPPARLFPSVGEVSDDDRNHCFCLWKHIASRRRRAS